MNEKIDYLIVGQGIAGSSFAWNLFLNKKNFLIVDKEKTETASNAAMGVYNPITGRRHAETWNAEILFKDLEFFYTKVEKILKTKILFKKKILRHYKSNKDQNEWNSRLANPKYKKYLLKEVENGVITTKSGYLNVTKYLSETKKYFKRIKRYKKYNIDKNDISVRNKIASVTGFDTKNIVMSIGIDEKNSGKFSYLPLNEVSGNSIIIKSKYYTKYIINRGISIVPIQDGHLHVGSTYHNGNEDKGIDDLLNKTLKITKKKYTLVSKKFGIRPASKDRRPMIGRHPKIDNLYIINGLGSKGVSQAPYCSKQLFDYIENRNKINREINIKRFNK